MGDRDAREAERHESRFWKKTKDVYRLVVIQIQETGLNDKPETVYAARVGGFEADVNKTQNELLTNLRSYSQKALVGLIAKQVHIDHLSCFNDGKLRFRFITPGLGSDSVRTRRNVEESEFSMRLGFLGPNWVGA